MHPDLLFSIGLCVTSGAVLALVAQRFRQPLLLAYLLAGVLIGPKLGLGWIADDESIHNVAEIGLILLLFLIGLEMDVKKLAAAGQPVLLAGFGQFLICLLLGLAFFWSVGFRIRPPDYGLLYLAVCLGLSSTMIVVKLLYDKRELDTLAGRISLGVLVFQDLWAIVILAVQPNLANPHLTPLLASVGKSIALVLVTLAASRWLLPAVFRSVAKQPELMLVASLAWCFAVSGASSYAGLSREMGALMAGVSLCAMPYNLDIIAKVISIRDFFITLFFVALGMQIPAPSVEVVGWAVLGSTFLILSRFLSIFPLLRGLKMGHRTSLLPAINLAQMSEFALVIAALGVAHGQIPNRILSILIFIFVLTSVVSTYLIAHNDAIARRLGALLKRLGLEDIDSNRSSQSQQDALGHDLVLLGFYHQASSLLHEWERAGQTSLLHRVLVIDFNPQVHAELRRRGIACIYGDLAYMETLSHAHIDRARLIVLTLPDSILRGTVNQRLLQQVRRLSPDAKVIATAERVGHALELYQRGADYVFITHLHSARERAQVIEMGLRSGFEGLRRRHLADLEQRTEVLH